MTITYRDYVAPMIPFLRSLPDAIRTCPEDTSLKFYGTGDTGHWAVQCSQQVLAALAVLADVTAAETAALPLSGQVSGSGADRTASFIGFDGKTYTVSIPVL